MDPFADLRATGRRPVVAQIGGFRPEVGIKSWFGGRFCAREGDAWPVDGDGPLVPVVQICVPEVPGGAAFFGDARLVQVFLNANSLPAPKPARNGEGWLLRRYPSLEGLATIETPPACRHYREFQIHWSLAESPDYPCWEESWNYLDMSQINDSEELSARFFQEFHRYGRTKIGGYASYIQSPCSTAYEYVLQLASEEKPRFIVSDRGNLYILREKAGEHWYLYWDCY